MTQTEQNNGNEPITIRTESKPDAVTLYHQRAQVRRHAKVALPATMNNGNEEAELLLYFAMPEEFDRDSVQVYFDEHTAENVILRATLFEEMEDEINEAEAAAAAADYASYVEKINDQLKDVTKQLALNKLDLAAVNDESSLSKDMFSRLCGPVTDGTPDSLNVEFWETQLKGVEERVRDACSERRRLEKKEAELKKTEEHLHLQLRELQQGNNDIVPLHNGQQRNTIPPQPPHRRKRRNWACLVLRVRSALPAASVFVTYATSNNNNNNNKYNDPHIMNTYISNPNNYPNNNNNDNNTCVGWHGEYTASLDPRLRRVTLRYTAVVRAAVEPLADVAITLSSASTRGGENAHGDGGEGAPPSFNKPWRLEATRDKGESEEESDESTSEGLLRTNAMWGRAAAVGADDDTTTTTTATDSNNNNNNNTLTASAVVNIALPSRYTFPTNGAPLHIPLAVLEWDADIAYTTVPDMVEAVFAHATCMNNSEYLLMPGKVAVFMDGGFVANAEIERTAPGEKLHIDFGVDNTIEVKRQLLQRLKTIDKASLFTRERKQRVLYNYSTVLTNKKQNQDGAAGAVTVTLTERIPKSNEEKLVVRLIEPKDYTQGKGKENEKRVRELEVDGKVEMQIKILPGETATIPFSFEVEAPHEATIFGL